MVLITIIVTGAYKPTYNWRGPYCGIPQKNQTSIFGATFLGRHENPNRDIPCTYYRET